MPLRTRFPWLALAVLLGLAAPATADVKVQDAWVRGTVPGQDSTGAYMKLQSSADAVITGAQSPVAKTVELHSMRMEGGMMKMRAIPRVALPAGKTVEFDPSGYHVMMTGVASPLRAGQTVPITLTIEDAKGGKSQLEVKAVVRPLAASAGMSNQPHDMPGRPH